MRSKQALAKVFMDDAFKDVRAVTTWITHPPENKLDPKDIADMKKLAVGHSEVSNMLKVNR